MIRPARETFCTGPHRLTHEQQAKTESFHVACDYALLALLEELPESGDPSKAWDCHSQVVGARRVLAILRTLHEMPEEKKLPKPPSLNYQA